MIPVYNPGSFYYNVKRNTNKTMRGGCYTMRELPCDEIYKLETCLRELAEHHNTVSVNFAGAYPKKPFRETLQSFEADVRSGKSKIAVIDSENRIVAFCKTDICQGQGKIDYLIVLKQYRGKG